MPPMKNWNISTAPTNASGAKGAAAVMRDLARWKELLHPDDRARVGDTLRQLLNGRRVTVEYRIVRPNDGEVRWIRDTGFPIYDEKGALTRVAGVGRDITPEKERQEALLVTQQRFRLLVEGAPEYTMFIIGLDNRITTGVRGRNEFSDGAPRKPSDNPAPSFSLRRTWRAVRK